MPSDEAIEAVRLADRAPGGTDWLGGLVRSVRVFVDDDVGTTALVVGLVECLRTMNAPPSVWLCPVHADEFWVPHDGRCPAPGCDEELVEYRRVGPRLCGRMPWIRGGCQLPEGHDGPHRWPAVNVIEDLQVPTEGN